MADYSGMQHKLQAEVSVSTMRLLPDAIEAEQFPGSCFAT